ncbi:ABC transporter permease [Neorhizobium galegae]|uniref:ABC transporter permease n=1 Tax=Neorhizobium galegae TaxID=399 RepID=UPI000620E92F|nr:ABC transporter permease [Neorhizobium galegae]MCQ1765970.1 ABC transporter permease [Neorhizobium galegae]MCQ1844884.1 ABC transporter permease [Neorhizobium galegae]CDZ40558.1 Probable nitrate/sulfonate ABC transporter, permease protein [Neorhizobium galegae bv. officinalis]
MTLVLRSWQGALALILSLAALASLPLMAADAPAPFGTGTIAVIFLVVAGAALVSFTTLSQPLLATILFVAAHLAVWLLLAGITGNEGKATLAFFLLVAASWLLAWRCVSVLSGIRPKSQAGDTFLRLLIPAIFGAWILILWEAATRGAGIPFIILPPPSSIGARLASSVPILWADAQQTIFKAVLFGYVVGCASGFVVAILADRIAFLRRGLLPIGNLMSALPIIGVAPIMVMWFGFDWQSKAAVVIIMTFFPMLVNTVAGLGASGAMERDLMRSYASDYWQTLIKLRLPAAMPFIFNALKINSTLALIGAIVAEFFGTPIVGMGFRISTEIGRMNVDMVWAEIAVAALIGSVFYGVVALGERATTFWHPSNRGG